MAEAHFVYILEADDGRYYTGYTTDLDRRLKQHQNGKGAKFTRAFGAASFMYTESFGSRSEALKREAAIKKLARVQKQRLIAEFQEKSRKS